MTDEYVPYYGLLLHSLVQANKNGVQIRQISGFRNGLLINEKIGLLLKHSTSRLSPWNYSFGQADQKLINHFQVEKVRFKVGLICGFVGVCVVEDTELNHLVDSPFTKTSRITIRTISGGSWDVSGNLGKLKRMKSKSSPWLTMQPSQHE